MFARSGCLRFSTPLARLSRTSAVAMPLRAKVTNPAIAGSSRMVATAPMPREQPNDDPDDVLFNQVYGVRSIELNRPKKLNSLNGSMVRKIGPRLKEWEKSDLANVVIVSGAGSKAFCAGGDVAALAEQNKMGEKERQMSKDFFALEYQLDHLIATYNKPYIALLDGITMGGGVGLSVHAPIRIATEKTVFAMPETSIGFFPDVGGSFFLPKLDGEIGTYLALTSERLTGVQALYAGIATHYFHSSSLANLVGRLSELVFRDTASLDARLDLVNRTLAEFSTGLPSQKEEPIHLSGSVRNSIDRCFSPSSVEEIIAALEAETENPEWAKKTLETLSGRSPTSLKVTLRQMRISKSWSITETFQREHQIASRFMEHPDFVSGVTSKLVNKPPTEPEWQPATLKEVSDKDVNKFFNLPAENNRLGLLNPDEDFSTYPHARFMLPSEKVIESYVRGDGKRQSRAEVVERFWKKWEGKDGVRQKVWEVLKRRTEERDQALKWI